MKSSRPLHGVIEGKRTKLIGSTTPSGRQIWSVVDAAAHVAGLTRETLRGCIEVYRIGAIHAATLLAAGHEEKAMQDALAVIPCPIPLSGKVRPETAVKAHVGIRTFIKDNRGQTPAQLAAAKRAIGAPKPSHEHWLVCDSASRGYLPEWWSAYATAHAIPPRGRKARQSATEFIVALEQQRAAAWVGKNLAKLPETRRAMDTQQRRDWIAKFETLESP